MMLNILIYLKDCFFALVKSCDIVLIGKIVLTASPLLTGFIMALKLLGGKPVRFNIGFLILYLVDSLVYFAFAFVDHITEAKTFSSMNSAIFVSAALFLAQTLVYLLFFLSARDRKDRKKKRFVAKISESPIPHVDSLSKKAYPLKSNVIKEENGAIGFDADEMIKLIQNIGDKELSFSDEEEYNRLIGKAKFLSGVAVNGETASEFCDLFMRSVKLASRYE